MLEKLVLALQPPNYVQTRQLGPQGPAGSNGSGHSSLAAWWLHLPVSGEWPYAKMLAKLPPLTDYT